MYNIRRTTRYKGHHMAESQIEKGLPNLRLFTLPGPAGNLLFSILLFLIILNF